MRTDRNINRLQRIIRNAKTQIILAEQSKNYAAAYQTARIAIDETSRILSAMESYARAKNKPPP